MERGSDQAQRRAAGSDQGKKEDLLDGLPMESSPYLKYTDLEDYKQKAYGTEGHLQVKPNQEGGATEGPTLSGSGPQSTKLLSAPTTNVVDAASHCPDVP